MIRKTKYNLQHLSLYQSRAPSWLSNLIETIAEEVHVDIADELKLLAGKALKKASDADIEQARHRVCFLRLERLLEPLQSLDLGFLAAIRSAKDMHYKGKNNPWAWSEIHSKLNLDYLQECNKLKVQDRFWAKAAIKTASYTQSSISESAVCYCVFRRATSHEPDLAWEDGWSEEVKALETVLNLLKGGKA